MANCNHSYDLFSQPYVYDPNINTPGVYPPNRIERILNCCGDSDKWREFFLSEIVSIPDVKPNIQNIIEVSSCTDIIHQQVIRTPLVTGYTTVQGPVLGADIYNFECTSLTGKKLIIEGTLTQSIIYNAAIAGQSPYSVSFVQPFSTFIIVDADTPLSQKFNISVFIEDVFAGTISERNIFKNTTLFIKASKS